MTRFARFAALPWWAEAVAIGIASRLFTVSLILAASARADRLSPGLFLSWSRNPFTIWDGNWYLQIASTGYHDAPAALYQDFAFFPLWPIAIRAATLNGLLPGEIVGPVLANVFFLAASVVTYRAFLGFAERGTARVGLALVAFGPAAYIFSLAYSESLFLLLAAASFCTWGARRAAFVALAQLTRLMGLGLAIGGLAEMIRPARRREGALVFIGGAVAFAVWLGYIWWLTGDPFGYLRGSPSWIRATIGPQSLVEAPLGLGAFSLGYTLLMLLGSIRLLRDRQLGAGVFSFLAALTAITLASWSEAPRYAMAGFPASLGLALIVSTPRARWLLVLLFAMLEAAWIVAIYSAFGTP